MSEETTNPVEEITTPNELDTLKERAETLGVSFHPSIGVDKLREKVDAKLAETVPGDTVTPVAPEPKPKAETLNEKRVRQKREAAALVRIQVTCMNPNKRDYEGEMFMAGNSVVGTFKKYVPFDVEWHVPRIVYNMLKQRHCQVFSNRKDSRGRQVKEGKLIREFNVVDLDPLDAGELKALAQRQAMAAGTTAA